MGMLDLTQGLRIIESNPARGFFAGPRDPALIAAAESALGRTFPPTYREFLQRLGAGSFGAFEFYGVTTSNFDNAKVPNGIWLTLSQRKHAKLPQDLLIIGDTGDGAYYCLKLQNGKEEAPVIIYEPGLPIEQQRFETVAKDFGEFFANQSRDQA
jgi:hypothetical protein